jgi:hypothetical protein
MGCFPLACSSFTIFTRVCFRISPDSRPGESTRGLRGVGVDGPSCAKSVSAAGCAVTVWSVAQASAIFRRNALYFNFEEGFSFLKTEKNWKWHNLWATRQLSSSNSLFSEGENNRPSTGLLYQLPSWIYYTRKYKEATLSGSVSFEHQPYSNCSRCWR